MKQCFRKIIIFAVLVLMSSSLIAAELRPFTLALTSTNSMGRINEAVLESLKNNGFEILGDYVPESDVNIFAITSKELKKIAAKTKYGGFGAAIHVSITRVKRENGKKEIQVAYNNPEYLGIAYNLGSRLKGVKAKLAKALGAERDFGGAVDEEDLPTYNYTVGMEGFTNFMELGEHGSYRKALNNVEKNLAENKFGISQIFRLDIPGKKQTLFGIGMKANVEELPFINDANVMKVVDHQTPRRSAHLPYEILVMDDGRVIMMHIHFRMAVNFPDLKMFGAHGFGRLIQIPYDFEEYITQATGGQWPPEENW